MRLLAFTFLSAAAVNWPGLWLDRAGVALLGVACMALALPARTRRLRRPTLALEEPGERMRDDRAEPDLAGPPARIGEYLSPRGGTP